MPIFARNLETSPEVQGRQISSGKEKRRWITWYRILMVGSLPSISKVVVGTQQWRSKTRAFKIDAMNQTLPRYHYRRSSCSHICSHEFCTNSPDISSQPLLTWSCSRGNRFSFESFRTDGFNKHSSFSLIFNNIWFGRTARACSITFAYNPFYVTRFWCLGYKYISRIGE